MSKHIALAFSPNGGTHWCIWLRHCATSWKVTGLISSGFTGIVYLLNPSGCPVALRASGGWGFQISRHSAHESDKVVSPWHLLPLPPRKYSWYLFLLGAESTPGPLCSWKDQVSEHKWVPWISPGWPVPRDDNLATFMCQLSRNSGSLNLVEP